eukprot:767371-Hanusia_phi.AAC.3
MSKFAARSRCLSGWASRCRPARAQLGLELADPHHSSCSPPSAWDQLDPDARWRVGGKLQEAASPAPAAPSPAPAAPSPAPAARPAARRASNYPERAAEELLAGGRKACQWASARASWR